MNVAIVYGVTLLLLFGLAYFTKRRFGVLGLALAAGAMLSSLWAQQLTPLVKSTGIDIAVPPLATVVAVILVLLPAVLLLTSGPTYHKKVEQVIGALLFATLAVALLIEPLGSGLILQGDSKQVYDWFFENRVYLVTAGLIAALVDLLFAKTSSGRTKH
ncbi:MAG: hypothetical protein JWM00_595 [Candidatus Saccharibacteria bacterium]|nr:hypothetical protein [Candidatus Saccharibacteria bacterium]